MFPARSDEEMKAMLAEHFFCKSDDDTGFESTTEEVSNESSTTSDSDDVDPLDDEKVKELLDGLGDE